MPHDEKTLTTTSGAPIADNANSMTAGCRGPVLLEDYHLIEKLAHQNRERIPERTVHAKGIGVFGTFTVTHDISKYTKANVFSEVGKKTDVFWRCSTVAGERGSADMERDVRGWALKFYTEEGNWDIVGNNTPVFFIRDPMKFPDFIHSQKRHPATNMKSNTAMWDFWSLSPESLHQVTILMSDRGIPLSLRHINGYGSHTYSFINAHGERFWVKYHFKTRQGIKTVTNRQAEVVVGKTRESSLEDMTQAINAGDFPQWDFKIQIMTNEQMVACTTFNPFDVTTVWPHAEFPLIDVGVLELNRMPDNYHAQVEQAAFSPSNLVPGISHSPDKMLQGRLFSYPDAQRYRIGGNYNALPVNAPKCPVNTYHKDGVMNFGTSLHDSAQHPDAFYDPNTFGGPKTDGHFAEPRERLKGPNHELIGRFAEMNADEVVFQQSGNLFRMFSDNQKEQLFGNIAEAMHGVPRKIVDRQLALFQKADPDYAAGVRNALKEVLRHSIELEMNAPENISTNPKFEHAFSLTDDAGAPNKGTGNGTKAGDSGY